MASEITFECSTSITYTDVKKEQIFIENHFNIEKPILFNDGLTLVVNKQSQFKNKLRSDIHENIALLGIVNTGIIIDDYGTIYVTQSNSTYTNLSAFTEINVFLNANTTAVLVEESTTDTVTYINDTTVSNVEGSTGVIGTATEFLVANLVTKKESNTIQAKFEINSNLYSLLNSIRSLSSKNLLVLERNKVPNLEAEIDLKVKDIVPFKLDTDCINRIQSGLKRLTIPVRLGTYDTILEFDSDNLEIKHVYRLPYGLKYDKKKIYGRIILNKPHIIRVSLNDNTVIDIVLKPVHIEKYNF